MEFEFVIRAARQPIHIGSDEIELFAWQKQCHQVFVAQPIELKKTATNTSVEPFLRIDKDTAQKLMDDLWDCGLRPSEGSGSAGALKAVQNHLADMKRIAFHALKIINHQ